MHLHRGNWGVKIEAWAERAAVLLSFHPFTSCNVTPSHYVR